MPDWLEGDAIAAIGLGLLILGRIADDWHFEPPAGSSPPQGSLPTVFEQSFAANPAWMNLVEWGAMAALAAAFAWLARSAICGWRRNSWRRSCCNMHCRGSCPGDVEPIIAPLILLGLAAAPLRLVPAMTGAMLIVIGWAFDPVLYWLTGAFSSILADPMFVTSVPAVDDALIKLLIPAALIGASLRLARMRLQDREWIFAASAGTALAAIAAHSLYKQLFAIGSPEAFVAFGLAERTLWEALLLGSAAALWRFGQGRAGAIVLGVAFAHSAFYTLLLHDPLWSSQAVGALPLLNLLPLTYAVPVAVILIADRTPQIRELIPERTFTLWWMALVILFAASMLRQFFHGSLLVEPGLGQAEDIARSILAIALAIGFLLWGIRTQQRDWRIGSLVLMLGAVAKVFLWDTSGLEGLVRIASFVALGFSLIGIGWLYSRQLAPIRT